MNRPAAHRFDKIPNGLDAVCATPVNYSVVVSVASVKIFRILPVRAFATFQPAQTGFKGLKTVQAHVMPAWKVITLVYAGLTRRQLPQLRMGHQ